MTNNTTDYMVEPHDPGDLYDRELAGKIANKLNKHYPGHLWAVNVNSTETAQVCNIFDFAISSRYGYVLHLSTIESDPALDCVMRAGGEMLERARMARGEAKGEFACGDVDGILEKHLALKSGIIQ